MKSFEDTISAVIAFAMLIPLALMFVCTIYLKFFLGFPELIGAAFEGRKLRLANERKKS